MSSENDLFGMVAEKLAIAQKTLIALLTAAVVFSVADLFAGHQAKSEIDAELQLQVEFARKAEDVTSRLRFMLSHLYPDRSLGERQRLTLLIQDIRRARRSFESSNGMDATLMNYKEPMLPLTGDTNSRQSIRKALTRPRQLTYFKGQQPDFDGFGEHIFINVGINEISPELAVNQQPVVHCALLLLSALALPGELADAMETFVRSAKPKLSERAPVAALQTSLDRLQTRSDQLDEAFSQLGGNSELVADQLLSLFLRRAAPISVGTSEDAAVRAAKYELPSTDDLHSLITELRGRYFAEHARARGERVLEVPGTTLRLPGHLFLLMLPVLILAVIMYRLWLASQGRGVMPQAGTSLRVAELKYGYLVLRLLGMKAERSAFLAWLQIIFVTFGPMVLVATVAIVREQWTYWIGLSVALVVLIAEGSVARRVLFSRSLATWPGQEA